VDPRSVLFVDLDLDRDRRPWADSVRKNATLDEARSRLAAQRSKDVTRERDHPIGNVRTWNECVPWKVAFRQIAYVLLPNKTSRAPTVGTDLNR
jgi:hypothetical protein